MSKCLVTGYKGYIGSKLFTKLNDGTNVVRGIDLKDGRDVIYHLPNESYDYVFHLAAFPSIEQSVHEPSDTFRNNAYATSVLLEWAKNHNVKRVIFSSSAAAKTISSPYGLQKHISELESKLYSQLYGLDTVSLRYHNVYSEDQQYGGSYSTVIGSWMEMIRQGKPLRIDGDGEQTRDFIHTDDVVGANIFCMNYKNNFDGEIFDVASGSSYSLNQIKKIIDLNYKVKWNKQPKRKGDIKHSHSCISELLSIGWKPTITIEEGLKKCFLKN
tara:strand:- start:92 stop:904 length:813 start_codon:yes stop_codon:yes gene_type:complete